MGCGARGGLGVTVLKGRPERPAAIGLDTAKPRRRSTLDDAAVVKVTTRLTNGMARQMRMVAVQQGITIEEAYTDAVAAYLRGF